MRISRVTPEAAVSEREKTKTVVVREDDLRPDAKILEDVASTEIGAGPRKTYTIRRRSLCTLVPDRFLIIPLFPLDYR